MKNIPLSMSFCWFFLIPTTLLFIQFRTPLLVNINRLDWASGFSHPLTGWDHLVTMLAVGVWAAQLRGAAIWLLPLAFVGVMSLGGLAGAAGLAIPSAEGIILLSCAVLTIIISQQLRFNCKINVLIVAFFGFFHGFAHGQEISMSASLISYTLGFMLATLLLHGAGILLAKVVLVMLAPLVTAGFPSTVLAKSAVTLTNSDPVEMVDVSAVTAPDIRNSQTESRQPVQQPENAKALAEIVVEEGRAANLIGLTSSASQGEISQQQFEYRPISRNGELVEVVPGALATQHSGSGKANQYFLRGFNLDHGTDFTTIVDGIPMNMPSHAHGQGYMDLNSLIPELISKVAYGKGPYYAEVGDFSAAGFAKMTSMTKLPQGMFKFTAGTFDYYRTLLANTTRLGDGDLLYAGEFNLYNGVWQQPEDAQKFNGMLRYALDSADWGMRLTAKGYANRWTATNQIAQANIDSGVLNQYGSMNRSDGGNSQRYSLATEFWQQGKASNTTANLYALYYDISLFSDFTGYLHGPLGDQINQFEQRVQTGGNLEHTRYHKLWGFEMDNTLGLNFRHDEIMGLGLNNTVQRQYLSTVSLADVSSTNVGLFFKNKTYWHSKLRTELGLRGDVINNEVTSLANPYTQTSALCLAKLEVQSGCIATDAVKSAAINAANSGNAAKLLMSPKFSLILGPWYETEYFLNLGYGYHSNDARGTTQQVDPTTGNSLGALGKIAPMAWGRGGEVGIRSQLIPDLNSTVALWWLESSQELVWAGDAGTNTVNGKSHRYGVEWSNYYHPTSWLSLDADLALTTARFASLPDGCVPLTNPVNGTMPCTTAAVPNSVGRVVSAGATLVAPNGLFGTLRLRHFGDVALDNQGTWAPTTSIVNLGLGYKQKEYKLELDVFNLLGANSNDIAYAYTSQYPANALAQYGMLKHPVEPTLLRGTVTVNF